ncbi:Fc.00g114110.m01.CDS01 [Cosmosporella sp. VM-42]
MIATIALGELWESLTWARFFGYGALFLVASFVLDFASQPRYPKQIPMLGHGRGWWAKVKNSIAYFTKHQSWIKEGYVKYGKNGLPFIAPAPISRAPDVILPRSQIAWMMDQPDRVLSSHHAHNSILYTEYNFLGKRMAEPFANRVMHKYLARHLQGIIPSVEEEVKDAIDEALGKDTEEWKSINLWEMWLEIVPKVTSRLLVGKPICRDETFLKGMVRFTDDVVRNSFLLHMFPKVLHPIFGRLFAIPNRWHWGVTSEQVLPVIQKRLLYMVRKEAGEEKYKDWEPPEDFITWDIRLAQAEGNKFELDPVVISKRLLPVEFAAIHTTVLTGQSWMFDLLSTPPEDGILDTLRDEIRAHMPASGHWTKASLASLLRVDSSIRESQRLSNFAATLIERMVIAPEGLKNPDYGWTLPRGAFVTVNLQGTHHDEELYENALGYDPLRFSRIREAWENKSEHERQQNEKEGVEARGLGMVTTSDKHLAFGHGRHACPGRFFVAYELKLIMAYLLLNYDIKMLDKRPQPQWIGGTIIPPLDARIEVRRKKDTI